MTNEQRPTKNQGSILVVDFFAYLNRKINAYNEQIRRTDFRFEMSK